MPCIKPLTVAVSLAITLSLAAPAFAQEKKIKLRVADSLPATHEVVTSGTKYFLETVAMRMNNEVEFEYFGSEQLGKARDLLTLTASGAVDIGYVAPSLVPEKMPLSEVAMLPGLYTTSCIGTQAFWKLLKEGVLGQTELKQQGMHVLFAVVQPPNALVLTNTDPREMKALTGFKIRSSGGPQDLIIKSMGAVPIRMSGPEMYESLSRQTISGMIVSYQSMFAYSWVDLSKYATQDLSYGGFSFTYMMSESRWKQLPEKLRRVMTEVGEETNRRLCERMDKDIDVTIEKLRQRGMTIGPLSPAAKVATQSALSSVLTQWASNLDRQGKPATRTLAEFRAATKQ